MSALTFLGFAVVSVLIGFGMPAAVGIAAEKRGYSLGWWGIGAFLMVLVALWVSLVTRTLWSLMIAAVVPAVVVLLPNKNKTTGITLDMPLPPKKYPVRDPKAETAD